MSFETEEQRRNYDDLSQSSESRSVPLDPESHPLHQLVKQLHRSLMNQADPESHAAILYYKPEYGLPRSLPRLLPQELLLDPPHYS